MDDPNVICIIKGHNEAAVQALDHPRNDQWIWRSARSGSTAGDGSATPPLGVKKDPLELRLTFDHGPKNVERGFVFGSNPQLCDVFLGPSHRAISRSHFCITFDEHRRLIIQDASTHGTAVGYNRPPKKDEKRTHFRWVLFHDIQKITIHLPLDKDSDMIFGIEGANREWKEDKKSEEQYEELVTSYLKGVRGAIPPLAVLGIHSQNTTMAPTGSHSPRRQPIYLKRKKLGSGSYGTVHKMINVSTGDVYAGKRFRGGSSFEVEVQILRSLSHDHIVRFMDFIPTEKPLLLMEYFPMRCLESQHAEAPITKTEIQEALIQGLRALDYLHLQHIVHRDLKPANILVRCRAPLSIAVADFGLSNQKDQSFYETICGTYPYCAPEIFERVGYFTAVDIWALGVVALEYLRGIPAWRNSYTRHDLPWWTKKIAAIAATMENASPHDPCLAMVVQMLQLDHLDRPSAGECLTKLSGKRQIEEVSTTSTFTPGQPSIGSDGIQPSSIRIQDPNQEVTGERSDDHRPERQLPDDVLNRSGDGHLVDQAPMKRKDLSGPPRPLSEGIPKRPRKTSRRANHLDVDSPLGSSKICLYLHEVSTLGRLSTGRFELSPSGESDDGNT